MRVSPACDNDIDALVRLLNEAYRAPGGWTNEIGILEGQRADAAMLRAVVESRAATLLTLREEADGPIVGCVVVEPTVDDGIWYLGSLSIEARRQDRGLGRHLLEAGEAHVRASGGRRVRMTVIEGRDSLIAWYERRGYARTGAFEPFPYDDRRFGAPVAEGLRFVVLERPI